jgi:two-component system sensor histidine kinase KdpD
VAQSSSRHLGADHEGAFRGGVTTVYLPATRSNPLTSTAGRAQTSSNLEPAKPRREELEPALTPERVMVCMSSNALAPRVIWTGARIAGRLGSRWYAVHVERPADKPGKINLDDADALRQNIRLAERLGAIVVRVKAGRPADGLTAFAQREGITHVIFGQSGRSRWEVLWRGSTIDRFLSTVRDATVQVVPLDERSQPPA